MGISVIIDVCSRHCANPVAEEATGETGIDCLQGLWEDISGRLDLLDKIRKNICYYANSILSLH